MTAGDTDGDRQLAELVRLVSKMRQLQRKYFATRDDNLLKTCKMAEREVDSWVASYFDRQLRLDF